MIVVAAPFLTETPIDRSAFCGANNLYKRTDVFISVLAGISRDD